jgi:YidC/Oxa1 family membrane protein insertase
MMLQRSSDPQQQMMNTLMNFMPLMIVFFAIRYPSGLALYWVTSTVIGILIQFPITGWGLVPFLGSGSIGGFGGRPSPSRPAAPKRPGSGAGPKPSPADGLGPVPTDGSTNGTDGQSSNGSAAPRPRKKANRARGGKSGGRRG